MIKTLNEKRAKTAFTELVGRVSGKKDTVIVEQHGKPVVAMIDFKRYQTLTAKRERLFGVIDRVWGEKPRQISPAGLSRCHGYREPCSRQVGAKL